MFRAFFFAGNLYNLLYNPPCNRPKQSSSSSSSKFKILNSNHESNHDYTNFVCDPSGGLAGALSAGERNIGWWCNFYKMGMGIDTESTLPVKAASRRLNGWCKGEHLLTGPVQSFSGYLIFLKICNFKRKSKVFRVNIVIKCVFFNDSFSFFFYYTKIAYIIILFIVTYSYDF